MIRIIKLVICLSFASLSLWINSDGLFSNLGPGTDSGDKFNNALYDSLAGASNDAYSKYVNFTIGLIVGYNIYVPDTWDVRGV